MRSSPPDRAPTGADPYDTVVRLSERLQVEGPDEATECELPAWRYEAAVALAGQQGREVWPPVVADPFPEVVGRLPEVDGADYDPTTVVGAMLHHGAVIIRGLVRDPDLSRLRGGIDQAFAAREAADGQPGSGAPWYVPFRAGGNTVGQKGKHHLVRLVDSPRLLADVLATYQRLGLLDLVGDYFGEPPIFTSNKTVLRRLEVPAYLPTDYHQDGQFMGAEVRSANVWVTLDDCGIDAPGLDVVPRREAAILPTGSSPSGFDWTLSAEEVEAAAGATPPVRLDLRAGDGLLFDLFLTHRTGYTREMPGVRRAIEFWFFAPSSMPPKYQALRA